MANIIDENLPLKKMRVRAKDAPYMTTNWKNAIRAKRRALATYQNDNPIPPGMHCVYGVMKPRDKGE